MAMDTTAADPDFELVSTLREIDPQNYSYLFERCKSCNINARQLRFLRQDHIRQLITKNGLGIIAEFEYLLKQWQISKGYASFDTKMHLNQGNESKNLFTAQGNPQVMSNNQPVVVVKQSVAIKPLNKNLKGGPISSLAMVADKPDELLTVLDTDEEDTAMPKANIKKFDEIEAITLENLIPKVLKKYKQIYQKQKVLLSRDRRVLCGSIVHYFISKNVKFNTDRAYYLAEQIVEHFPTEDMKSWCNPGSEKERGILCGRYLSSKRWHQKHGRLAKQVKPSTSKLVNHSYDEDSKSIQDWLKSNNCENLSEIIDLWEDTKKYRCSQIENLKDLKSIRAFLSDWPSYKLEKGHELLTMDFKYFYPQAMETFRTRWLVYKQNIEPFLKVELKNANCIKLLEKYQLQKATTNEDSSSCILIHLVHAITKPLRHFETVNGNVSYGITDSQQSMTRLIQYKAEMDEYTEPYPCIFVVGDSLLEVQECYVVFMDLRYKLSYENCLAVCVQIFTVFKVKDPQASQCFWEFIRCYMFNIVKDEEKSNEGTENMINYLETVTSSV